MPDGTGYNVVPGALHDLVGSINNATDDWDHLTGCVSEATIRDDDLGSIGKEVEIPSRYNSVLGDIVDKLELGKATLTDTAETLRVVAKHYLELEAKYYTEFGYLEEKEVAAGQKKNPGAEA